jgi:hypothetical protein
MTRLDALASEIHNLRSALPEAERDAYGVDITAIERAAVTRARLDAALALYFNESEQERNAGKPEAYRWRWT